MGGPSCVQEPNDRLINKLVKLTKSVKTYQSKGWGKQKDTRVQSSHQQHNDRRDLQATLEGSGLPLNEAAEEPAAAVENCGSLLVIWGSICHMKRKMTEDFKVVRWVAPFHHYTVTFKRWFLKDCMPSLWEALIKWYRYFRIFLQRKTQDELNIFIASRSF